VPATAPAPRNAAQIGPRRAIVVGASSGVGRALAEELASRGADVLLVATDLRDLLALRADLRLRFSVDVHCEAVDLSDGAFDADGAMLRWRGLLAGCDTLLIPAGYVDATDEGPPSARTIDRTMTINYTGPARLLSACATVFEKQGHGTLAAFSSIAAAVPRRKRIAYTAAKAALETHLAGLRHHFAGTNVRVQTYALGYVDTSMSFGQKLLFPVATPEAVARHVVDRLDRDTGLSYVPSFWWGITRILRMLPWSIYRRLKF
jgi:short-subunit dehydrogenase